MSKLLPKVSVAMITYNHEAYIEQAVRSVLMQETAFEYEIVIGDDCSSDETRAILLKLQAQYPEKIILQLHETNQGVMKNLLAVLDTAGGEYVALLEGDDYWTSPDKLQIQADYLDAHPECSLSFHSVNIYSQQTREVIRADQQVVVERRLNDGETFSFAEVAKSGLLPRTCSVMYRASMVELPEWSVNVVNGDVVLTHMAAQAGLLVFLDQNLATYRIHDQGIWSGASSHAKQMQGVSTFEYLNRHFNYQYSREFGIGNRYLVLALRYHQVGESTEARRWLKKAIFQKHNGRLRSIGLIKTLALIYMPWLYSRFQYARSKILNTIQ